LVKYVPVNIRPLLAPDPDTKSAARKVDSLLFETGLFKIPTRLEAWAGYALLGANPTFQPVTNEKLIAP
jgi:hypothetical protein